MSNKVRAELPGWLSSASVAWMGALLALLAVSLTAGFLWYEQRELDRREVQSGEVLARVLEDHANRTFNTIDIALATLSETVRSSVRTIDPIRLGPVLQQAQQGMPFLRSVSLLDAQGRVLASSAIDNVDVVVDLRRVPLPAAGVVDRLGSLVAGRDLAEASGVAGIAAAIASPRSFVPLVRRATDAPEAGLYLVAVLNPDFFANEYQLTLGDTSRAAALFGIDGVLLTGTDNIRLTPGQSAAGHRFFTDFLPARESGSDIGPGIDGGRVVAAFRTLRKRPVAVLVERDYASVQAELARTAAWVGAACAVALAVVGAMVGTAWRSLRSHEAVHVALQATRERVASSESDLRTLVESVHELIFRTDAQGRVTFLNKRWEQISGRPGAAALGRRLASLCVAADRARIEALFASGAAASETMMAHIATPQGELRTIEVSVAAVRAADGTVAGFAGLAVDVSERQLARGALEAQLDFTARLLEVSPTPLFVKDERGRFITVNRAWLELMALSREQVIGRDSGDLFGADAPKHSEHDQRLLHSEDRVSYENRLARPDGEVRDTFVTKVRFNRADGTPAGIIGSIIDVTEFREAERSTRDARDAAERANRAKSDFIANISHELRTPLQSIIGFSELGAELARTQPDFHEMFGDIHAGGQRMLTLVNGLLDVSKMESTVGSLTLHRCDLAALAADVVKELRPLAAQRGLELALSGGGRPLAADVDAFRMCQVMRNVLANAMRFAPPASRVEIGFSDRAGDGVEMSVRDHGPGIPIDELETIFDAFVQSSRTRDGSGGTGLGLTICRKIMSAHGGSIDAANAAGGGALIRIRLPACMPALQDAAGPSLPESAPMPEFEAAVLVAEAQ